MGPDPSLTPELVGAQSFTSSFRGYDSSEVRSFLNRVATELRELRERCGHLESAWHSAEERAARPPVLDEDTLMAAVGEETASILRTARAAAAEIRNKATEEADKVLADARSEAERMKAEALEAAERETEAAKVAAGRETQAAKEAAERVVHVAQSDAAEMIDKARVESDQIRAKAETDRALSIEGANATRERILEDLSRRRRVATVQIEQLRAGRERLIGAYAVVRRTLEEAQSELSRADAEARLVADDVGRRLRAEADPQLSPETEAQTRVLIGSTDGSDVLEKSEVMTEAVVVVIADDEAIDLSAEAGDSEARSPEAGPSGGGPDVESSEADAPDKGRRRGSSSRSRQAKSRAKSSSDASYGPPRSESGDPPAPSSDVDNAADNSDSGVDSVPSGVEAAVEATIDLTEVTSAEGGDQGGSAEMAQAADPTTASSGPAGSAVDELFAKIRSSRQPGSDDLADRVSGGAISTLEAPTSDLSTPDVAESGEALMSDGDELLLQKRESAVLDLEVNLTRKLKRALQDEQNDLLDRLRSLRGTPSSERLMPEVEPQIARYAEAIRVLAERAARAGVEFASQSVGAAAEEGDLPQMGDLSSDAAHSIVDPLRRRLEQAIETSREEEQSVLVEALGAAYREWKSQRIERVAGDVLSAVFSRGTWHATPDGVPLRWIVEDADGPCPDCDDDALAGEMPKGDAFPTGQHYPPAHSGCRCLLVPVTS